MFLSEVFLAICGNNGSVVGLWLDIELRLFCNVFGYPRSQITTIFTQPKRGIVVTNCLVGNSVGF